MNLKVRNNLFIIGTRVISYETEVARIKGDTIVMNGKYSRTTGKQMGYLEELTGLRVVHSDRAGRYLKFYLGVKCEAGHRINISEAGAKKILSKLKHTTDLEKAAALAYVDLWAMDRAFVKLELMDKGWTHESLLEAGAALREAIELGVV